MLTSESFDFAKDSNRKVVGPPVILQLRPVESSKNAIV
jgi:hypothetical protein